MGLELPTKGEITLPNPKYQGRQKKTNQYSFNFTYSAPFYQTTPFFIILLIIILCLSSLQTDDTYPWPFPTIKYYTELVIFGLLLNYWLEIILIIFCGVLSGVLLNRFNYYFRKMKNLKNQVHKYQYLNNVNRQTLEDLARNRPGQIRPAPVRPIKSQRDRIDNYDPHDINRYYSKRYARTSVEDGYVVSRTLDEEALKNSNAY